MADRFVQPTLSQEDITEIAAGRHQMDAFVRRYIDENLSYRFVKLADGKAANALEAAIKSGKWERGRPLLSPTKMIVAGLSGQGERGTRSGRSTISRIPSAETARLEGQSSPVRSVSPGSDGASPSYLFVNRRRS